MCVYIQNEKQVGNRAKQVLLVDYSFNAKFPNSLKVVHKRGKCFADFKYMTYELWHTCISSLIRIRKQFNRKRKAVITFFFFNQVTHYCTVFVFLRFFCCSCSSIPLHSPQDTKCVFLNVLCFAKKYCSCPVNMK